MSDFMGNLHNRTQYRPLSFPAGVSINTVQAFVGNELIALGWMDYPISILRKSQY